MKHSHSNMTSPLNFKMSHLPVTSFCTFSIITNITKFLPVSPITCLSRNPGHVRSKAPFRKPPDSRYTNLTRIANPLQGHQPTKPESKLYAEHETILFGRQFIIDLEV